LRTQKLNAEIIARLQQIIPAERLFLEEPLSAHTTFHIGGPAECLLLPMTIDEVVNICAVVKANNIPLFILGGGSNLLVRDNGIAGIVIKLSPDCFGRIEKTDCGLRAYAGAMLKDVCAFAAAHSLTGIEFACGIPGSVGGAVYMNAGAYDGEMSNCVHLVKVLLPDGTITDIQSKEISFSYRNSVFQTNGAVILAVELHLSKADQDMIVDKMRDLTIQRESKQPLNEPSAGSTFKRPPGKFVGPMLEQAGLKGFTLGGAQVSEKHAGFVINAGNAQASDVLDLIHHVQNKIKEQFNVDLFPEVKVIGE
jgi:UDP-N-acetylmuramate dehydrogenase